MLPCGREGGVNNANPPISAPMFHVKHDAACCLGLMPPEGALYASQRSASTQRTSRGNQPSVTDGARSRCFT